MSEAAFWLFFLVVLVLFAGEPDIHDALLKLAMESCG